MQAQHIDFLELLDGKVHYVVPRWQRRYRWGYTDIERLVEDLVTIAAVDRPHAAHYGGTLLTFTETGAAGVVKTIRVVDGQQRLTTVSLLLDCISDAIGPDGSIGEWTAAEIRDCLFNPKVKRGPKRLKLRLQTGDAEEYRRCLNGDRNGPGTVAAAWRIARRLLVRKRGAASVLRGLQRFRVVSIGLESPEDPQQIFESLNATGRPLTETEKIKNWILMGLSDVEQEEVHDDSWLAFERRLGARHTTEPSDLFFRDFLRWKTGQVRGTSRVYEDFRRWAVGRQLDRSRPALCRRLARLAGLYGKLTGANGSYADDGVEKQLVHLRDMGLHVHRPMTLRLLHDASQNAGPVLTGDELAAVLAGVGTWLTRLWLADRPLNAVNRAATHLAKAGGPGESDAPVEYWLERIRRLQNTRAEVPDDDAVRQGIRTRKAYGGRSTGSASAVLWALVDHEHGKERLSRQGITIEHVMPQRLTAGWRRDLGPTAEEVHGLYRDRLANLTLTGYNPELGAQQFESKRALYEKSAIHMTRRVARSDQWGRNEMEQRAEDLTERALKLWRWSGPGHERSPDSSALRWRIDQEPWRTEMAASQMVLNVVSALLTMDPANAQKLTGPAVTVDLHSAGDLPKGHSQTLRSVPGHAGYVLYPYDQNHPQSARRCEEFGQRCDVRVEVEHRRQSHPESLWQFIKRRTGRLPGQKDTWKGPSQWTGPYEPLGDWILVYVGNPDWIWLFIRADEGEATPERSARMLRYSRAIRSEMGDQTPGWETQEKGAAHGRSLSVRRAWDRDDRDAWPEAVDWLAEQLGRMRQILERIGAAADRAE